MWFTVRYIDLVMRCERKMNLNFRFIIFLDDSLRTDLKSWKNCIGKLMQDCKNLFIQSANVMVERVFDLLFFRVI